MTTTPGDEPALADWLDAERLRLVEFARASAHPDGGFAWLDERGRPELGRPLELWITCRMTHVFALAHLWGDPGAGALVDHGVAALTGRFRDAEYGGWFASVDADGPVEATKDAYAHAFVVLAASSATVAGGEGAPALLDEAVATVLDRFWDPDTEMPVEQWDRTFTRLEDYRGVNAVMHLVEALLAAADVRSDTALRERALALTTRVVHGFARDHDWRVPEHFDPDWRPLLDYNADDPAHPFRPFGATVGHWFEWARLTLDLHAALGDDAPGWMVPDARALFDAGVRDGWAVDGADGFVYTVDFDGRPVVRQRMHWVAAEAVAAAAALHRLTGDPAYAAWHARWWAHVRECFVDPVGGSWWHELGPDNRPSSLTWAGKPDVYHAVQATLASRLPLSPAFAPALAAGLPPA